MIDPKYLAPSFGYPGKPVEDIPTTGNIYRDTWYYEGKKRNSYYIDCAGDYNCDTKETALFPARGLTATMYAKRMGWTKSKKHGQWLCPECSEKERNG